MRDPDLDSAPTLAARVRAKTVIAVGSGIAASVPAVVLTGSTGLGALTAVLTASCVVAAGLMI